MDRNNTLQAILDLEDQLKKLSGTSAVKAKLKTSKLDELKDAAHSLGSHVFQPFERNAELNYYSFEYCIPKTEHCINVVHTSEYRFEKTLVEI